MSTDDNGNSFSVDRLIEIEKYLVQQDMVGGTTYIAVLEGLGESGGKRAVNRLIEIEKYLVEQDMVGGTTYIAVLKALGRAGRIV